MLGMKVGLLNFQPHWGRGLGGKCKHEAHDVLYVCIISLLELGGLRKLENNPAGTKSVSLQKVAAEHFTQEEERRMSAEPCVYVQCLGNVRFTVCI